MTEKDEISKWLNLGYETYGPAGMQALARAMGLDIRAATKTGSSWTTTGIRGNPLAHEIDKVDLEAKAAEPQRSHVPAACPESPPRKARGWKPYVGLPDVFHCGYEGYVEERDPSPESPIAECFYDERGELVDGAHPYAGCKGTPDSYRADDPRHFWPDPGGIWKQGFTGLAESRQHANDLLRDAMRTKDYSPYSVGPFRAPLPR
jgi:hypothetical protein